MERQKREIKQARDEDHFFETDLNEWIRKLDTVKNDLVTPQRIDIRYDDNPTLFMSQIFVNQTENECFQQSLENIQIINNGTAVTNNRSGIS